MRTPSMAGWQAEVFKLAMASLRAHKLRGGLTILGIVIGITSVVGMVSLVQGLNRQFRLMAAQFGHRVMTLRRALIGIV